MPYSYDRRSSEVDLAEAFRASVIKAIKRVGDGVRAMGLGSVVKYNSQERIDEDSRGIHSTFFLRIEHAQVNPAYRPGINFYWSKSKESGSVGSSNLVWPAKDFSGLPLEKMADAMLKVADEIVKDLKRQLGEQESGEAWSVVTVEDGYAAEVDVFKSKADAERAARDRGDCYVVKGTQMWNEPLGQVEENDRTAPSKYFR